MDNIDNKMNKNKKEERVNKSDRTSVHKKRKEPCKITYQKTQGQVNENKKRKLDTTKEYTGSNNEIIMIITEKWLNKEKQDDKTYRSDRKVEKRKKEEQQYM